MKKLILILALASQMPVAAMDSQDQAREEVRSFRGTLRDKFQRFEKLQNEVVSYKESLPRLVANRSAERNQYAQAFNETAVSMNRFMQEIETVSKGREDFSYYRLSTNVTPESARKMAHANVLAFLGQKLNEVGHRAQSNNRIRGSALDDYQKISLLCLNAAQILPARQLADFIKADAEVAMSQEYLNKDIPVMESFIPEGQRILDEAVASAAKSEDLINSKGKSETRLQVHARLTKTMNDLRVFEDAMAAFKKMKQRRENKFMAVVNWL